jgi:hypothetical protein
VGVSGPGWLWVAALGHREVLGTWGMRRLVSRRVDTDGGTEAGNA